MDRGRNQIILEMPMFISVSGYLVFLGYTLGDSGCNCCVEKTFRSRRALKTVLIRTGRTYNALFTCARPINTLLLYPADWAEIHQLLCTLKLW